MAYITARPQRSRASWFARALGSFFADEAQRLAGVGGFPEDLRSAEDLLFLNKIDRGNFKIAHAPAALVHWQVQSTPWLTFKRFVTYARK
jgi:hypothetical protein